MHKAYVFVFFVFFVLFFSRVSIVKKNVRFAGDMGIKKNKHVEQWNGERKSTYTYKTIIIPRLD